MNLVFSVIVGLRQRKELECIGGLPAAAVRQNRQRIALAFGEAQPPEVVLMFRPAARQETIYEERKQGLRDVGGFQFREGDEAREACLALRTASALRVG